MSGVLALTILLCIYAAGELIAQKSKAYLSTVLGIAIILLIGFWSGIFPQSLITDAQVAGFGNIIAGILVVSLGTTIDFQELKRQWKVVVVSLICVIGAVAAIIFIGKPIIGVDMAVSGAPIFAGGSAAGVSITPIAFIFASNSQNPQGANVQLIPIDKKTTSEKLLEAIPDMVDKISDSIRV